MTGKSGQRTPADSSPSELRVLEALAGLAQPASLLEVVAAVQMTKSRVYRALRTLQENAFVDHLGRRGYRVGSRAIALASLIGPRLELRQIARPVLAQLSMRSGEAATLHLRSGAFRVCVLGVTAPSSSRRVTLGERAPLTSGCSGVAMLAHLDDDEVEAVIDSHPRGRGRKNIRASIAEARERGYAVSFSSNHVGLNGIGAAVCDPATGAPIGSIVISGAEDQFTVEKMDEMRGLLTAACNSIGPKLANIIGPNAALGYHALDVAVRDLVSG